MGTCISKCCLNSSTNLPQDKLVISQSPPPPKQQELLSITSSSSTSLSSSSSSNCTSSTSCSSSTLKLKPYTNTNDFLLSCAKPKPHIIILGPHKYDVPKSKRSKIDPPARPKLDKLPSKEEWSSSLQRSIVRQKRVISNQHMQTVSKPSRTLSSTNHVLNDCHRCCERKEKIRPLSNCNSSNRLNFKQSGRDTLVEDFDNPLISMDCFIFL